MNRQKRFREFCRFLGDFDRKVQKSGVSVVKRGDIRSRESFNIFQKCPRSRWLRRHTFFADIFRENEKVETIFACSYGTQIESFKQINGKKSCDTDPLSRILLGFFILVSDLRVSDNLPLEFRCEEKSSDSDLV